MQQGTLAGSYAEAVKDAANNESGAMTGFMGVGMMNNAAGGMMGGVVSNAFNNDPASQTSYDPYAKETTTEVNTTVNFCPNCGSKAQNGNFCTNCGNKLK